MKIIYVFLCLVGVHSLSAMDPAGYEKEDEKHMAVPINDINSAVPIVAHQLKLLLYATERISFYFEEFDKIIDELPKRTIILPYCAYQLQNPQAKGIVIMHDHDEAKVTIMESVIRHLHDLGSAVTPEGQDLTVVAALKTVNRVLSFFPVEPVIMRKNLIWKKSLIIMIKP